MNNRLIGFLTVVTLYTGFFGSLQAAGSVMVTPTRIVFGQSDRSAQVTLVNQSDQTSNFRISFIRQNMTENGDFLPVREDEAGMFSDPMIRFSPRQVNLSPGQAQVIRLALRKPRDLANGEYRSHMLFQMLPESSGSNVEKITRQSAAGISVELTPIIGVSIPVIVRQGDLQTAVTLTNAKIEVSDKADDNPRISVSINRTGNGSAYGDLKATFTSDGKLPVVIAQANKIAVYANMQSRRFEMPLNLASDANLQNGAIDLVFLKSAADDESAILARTRIILK